MSRIVYVNGSYVPEAEAKISVFDRAFLFGDGVYEVTAVIEGKLLDFTAHLARLDRSMLFVIVRFRKCLPRAAIPKASRSSTG